MKILVVEDEVRVAAVLKRGLEADGFSVDVAATGPEGLWRAEEGDYAAIVLDIMLPELNGFRVCSTLRERGDWTPVLMLTAKDGELDEAEALDTGADDFVRKPFSYVVLVARLRALLRRGGRDRPTVLEAGDLHLDPATHAVSRGDTAIRLTAREIAVLEFLLLGRTDSVSDGGLDRVVDRLADTPFTFQVDSRTTVLARDQSSLAALDIRGLLDLDAGYALAMSTVTIGIFVFGLLLQRRREYVVLRAQGLSQPAVRVLIAAEAVAVTVAGCVVGVAVGWVMAWFFVTVLRPLFVLPATVHFALGATALVVGVVLLATAVASFLGSHLVNRLEATELLRDE